MLLSRTTENPFETYDDSPQRTFAGRHEHNYAATKSYGDSEWRVTTEFNRFGAAKYRRPSFAVSVSWRDVESIIEKFCEVGCSEALALREAQKLAMAAKELGWRAPEIASSQANVA